MRLPGRSGIVADLEDALQDYFGVRHAVTFSSGTAALHATYDAARIKAGDEVIVPAWTFHATASPLFHLRAVPVLVETGADGNIDPTTIEDAITPRTRAIMVTHLWGRPAAMLAIQAIAKTHNLLLLEDGSHSHGASHGGKKVGTFGLAGVSAGRAVHPRGHQGERPPQGAAMNSPFADPTFEDTIRAAAETDGVERFVVAAVITDGDRMLFLRRPAGEFMAGLWELPSGKVEKDEGIEQALLREVAEETGLRIDAVEKYLGHFDYTSGSGALTRQLTFEVTVTRTGPVTLTEHDAHEWAGPDEIPAVSDAVRELVTR
ncbi:aminotransferase class I/II-fold pyridoxal phosphate-dependent enzyme [Kitasatospora sp. NPDC127116]|uniref:aminotransferase class I/II-fold pyridoxal phosphate-dependent enzyme n=1 Tax=Kitasatospora sp. NPDC127116 TaxID=3345367 RepID=UPI003638B05F